jgi:hypothetical protein
MVCSPLVLQGVMIGGPVLAILTFVLVEARMMVGRAHDLDEDLSYWRALLEAPTRRSPLQRRLRTQEGTPGPNRFGPSPEN